MEVNKAECISPQMGNMPGASSVIFDGFVPVGQQQGNPLPDDVVE